MIINRALSLLPPAENGKAVWGNASFAFCLYFMLLGCGFMSYGQENVKFDRLDRADGLSNSNVNTLFIDSRGWVWIGAEDALNCFNGTSVDVFRYDDESDNTIVEGRITNIIEDPSGQIWVGTDFGLCRYNLENKVFNQYTSILPEEDEGLGLRISSSVVDASGNLWFGSAQGLLRYRSETDDFERFQHDEEDQNSLASDFIGAMFLTTNGDLWIGTDDGLSRLPPGEKAFENIKPSDDGPFQLASGRINTVYQDKSNRLWVGQQNGMTVFDFENRTRHYYAHEPNDPRSVSNSTIKTINASNTGEIWIGTDDGLNRFDEMGGFDRYHSDNSDQFSLSSDIISQIVFDESDNMWIAAYLGGVCWYIKDRYGFTLERNAPNPTSLSSNKVAGFAESPTGEIVVATDGGGLNFYDRKSRKFKQLRHDPINRNSPTNDKTLTVQYDDDGLWLGMWAGGVDFYDPTSGSFRHYRHDPGDATSLCSDRIFRIFRSRDGDIWIGSWGESGASKYNRETDDFTTYSYDPRYPDVNWTSINHMREDDQGRIWFSCQTSGVIVLDPATGHRFSYLRDQAHGGLSARDVSATLEDSKGRIWVATLTGGLNLLDPETNTFKAYRKKHGLPSDGIASILEDDEGFLWLGTNYGISKFDPENETFKNFTTADGLQADDFKSRSSLKLSTGELLFGGNEGFNLFDPSKIKGNPWAPKVYFTDFQLFDEDVPIGPDAILPKAVTFVDDLRLDYNQNFFSFEFVGVNFFQGDNNEYKYQLQGLRDEWVDLGKQRKVSFTNVPPGDYTLSVLAKNNDGVPSNEPASIRIRVSPPFWATWWFRLTLLIAVFVGSVLLYRWRTTTIRRQQLHLEESVLEATNQVRSQNEKLAEQGRNLELAIQETKYIVQEAADSGNLRARIDLEGKTGEWLELGKSINLLFDSVASPFDTLNTVIDRMASGDLTARFSDNANGDVLFLAQNLNQALHNLTDLMLAISSKVDTVDELSEEMPDRMQAMESNASLILSSIEDMRTGARNQVNKVEESSLLMDGIAKSSNAMKTEADDIHQTAQLGVSKSEVGIEQIEGLHAGMKEIRTIADSTYEAMNVLRTRSTEISQILQIIKSIAAQTNLLALNAAIEAAQAGESGRGFSVIAKEIRQLAEEAKVSTSKIEELVVGVQSDTQSTSQLFSKMNDEIRTSESISKAALETFQEISEYYRKTYSKSEQISGTTLQQIQEIKDVDQVIGTIHSIANEIEVKTNGASSSSSVFSEGIDSFSELITGISVFVNQLRELVHSFHLNPSMEAERVEEAQRDHRDMSS